MLTFEGFCLFVLFAILAVVSFYLSRLFFGDYFAPLGIFLGINLLSLSLYHLRLIRLNNLSFQAYGLIAVSFFSFLLGIIFVSPSAFLKLRFQLEQRQIKELPLSQPGLVFFYYLTAILATIGWIILLINFFSSYSLKQIFELQRHFQSQQYIGYLNLLGILVPPSFVLLKMVRRRVTFLSIGFLLSALFGLLLAGIKTYIIFSLVVALLAGATFQPLKIRLRHLIVLALVIIAFMVAYNQFIDIFVQRDFTSSAFPKKLSYLESPYLYIVGPWPAMSAIMRNPPEQPHWGFLTFHFFWKILGEGLKIIPPVPETEPGVNIGSVDDFNVYPLIGGLYWDFGVAGAIIGCFLLALISASLYRFARKYGHWMTILQSSIFNYGLFISFFLYYYRFNLLFLMLYVFIFGNLSRKVPPLLLQVGRSPSSVRENV